MIAIIFETVRAAPHEATADAGPNRATD